MAAVFESFTPGDYQTVFVEWFFSNSSNESREVTGRVEEVLLAPADESLGRQQHYGIVIDVLALFNFNQKMGQLLLSYPRDLLGVLADALRDAQHQMLARAERDPSVDESHMTFKEQVRACVGGAGACVRACVRARVRAWCLQHTMHTHTHMPCIHSLSRTPSHTPSPPPPHTHTVLRRCIRGWRTSRTTSCTTRIT
jgi:hypothetical protein